MGQPDNERARAWLYSSAKDIKGRVDLDASLAAEFAAVRAPLERRIAALEAALRAAVALIESSWREEGWALGDNSGQAPLEELDVMAKLRAALSGGTAALDAMLERAVAEERERCAKTAEDFISDRTYNVGDDIAAAIRRGE